MSEEKNKSKGGRPVIGSGVVVHVSLRPDIYAQVEAFAQYVEARKIQDAVRLLVIQGLEVETKKRLAASQASVA